MYITQRNFTYIFWHITYTEDMLAVSQAPSKAREDPNFTCRSKDLEQAFLCTCTGYIIAMRSAWQYSRFLEPAFL